MWLQTDRVSCLKMLIGTIISKFQSTQKFTLWVLFSCFFEKFAPKFTLFLPYCFRDFNANSPTAKGAILEYFIQLLRILSTDLLKEV